MDFRVATALRRGCVAVMAANAVFVGVSAYGGSQTGSAGRAFEVVRDMVIASTSLGADVRSAIHRALDPSASTARWESQLAAFAESDRVQPPVEGGTVVIGSSSIARWTDLDRNYPAGQFIRRGLAGAHLADCTALVDRLVLPYRPRSVVVYAGDNDLADGATPAALLATYSEFVAQIHLALPQARIAFVSIKPSPSRQAALPSIRQANALIERFSAQDPRLAFVNIFTPMLDANGSPRRELFDSDGLHLSAAGYAVWNGAMRGYLDAASRPGANAEGVVANAPAVAPAP